MGREAAREAVMYGRGLTPVKFEEDFLLAHPAQGWPRWPRWCVVWGMVAMAPRLKQKGEDISAEDVWVCFDFGFQVVVSRHQIFLVSDSALGPTV